jgi:outer membrane protein TolC
MFQRLMVCCLIGAPLLAQSYATNGDAALTGYIEQAIERNPALSESVAKYRAALQRIPQVTSLPDPMFDIRNDIRSPETRVGPQMMMLSISQQFPWFGKLDERGKVAAKEADAVREMYDVRKAEIVRQVKLAYFDVAFVDRAIRIRAEESELLDHFATLAEARYSQGVGLQQAVVKLQAEITRVRSEMEDLKRQRVDAEAALNALLDRPPTTPVPPVALHRPTSPLVDLESLFAKGRDNRPELKVQFAEIEMNEKRIHAARKEYWPDFTVGAGYVNVAPRQDMPGRMNPPPDNGKDIYNFMVGINIPIRRRKRDAAVMEATEDFLAAREGYRGSTINIEASIRAIAFRLRTITEQMSLYEKVLLPQTEQALSSTEAAYSTGSLGVLELLDSERMLLDVRLGLAQFESDQWKTMAEMERATGSAFPEERP